MKLTRSLLFVALVLGGISALTFFRDSYSSRSLPRRAKPIAEVVERYNKLITFWQKELERDKINFVAAQNIGRMHMAIARATGDEAHYRAAEDILRLGLAITPKNDFSTESLLARAVMSRHAFADAKEIADRLVRAAPNNKGYLQLQADAALGLGDYVTAFADIEQLLVRAPGYSTFTRAAQMRDLQGRYDEGLDFYRRALKEYDGDDSEPISWAILQMGQNREKAGDFDAAESFYLEALDRTPEYPLIQVPLAKLYLEKHEDKKAKQILLEAVKTNPEPAVFSGLSELESRKGNTKAAEEFRAEALRRANLRAADGTGGHLRELAELLSDRGEDPARAVELAEQDLLLRPGDIHSHDIASRAYRVAGDTTKADEHARLASRLRDH